MDNNQIDGQKNNKESYCPNSLFDNGTISIGEFKTLEEAMSFPIKEIWCVNRKGDNKFQAYKDQGTRMLLICDWSRSIQDSLKFVLALIHQNGKIHYYDLNDLPLYPEERKNQYEGSLGDQATYTLYHLIENKQYNTNTNMNKKLIRLTESDLHLIVKESVNKILKEVDRHRDGYWKERWAKQKAAKQSDTEKDADTSEKPQKNASKPQKDRHRKGYYHDYNQAHPERLNRGYTKGYKNGNVSDGPKEKERQWLNKTLGIYIIGYDELGRPITNHPLSDMLRNKEMEWHDDDWNEGSWDD